MFKQEKDLLTHDEILTLYREQPRQVVGSLTVKKAMWPGKVGTLETFLTETGYLQHEDVAFDCQVLEAFHYLEGTLDHLTKLGSQPTFATVAGAVEKVLLRPRPDSSDLFAARTRVLKIAGKAEAGGVSAAEMQTVQDLLGRLDAMANASTVPTCCARRARQPEKQIA